MRARGTHRFRRRVTAAFVIVAAMSAGLLAVVTYALAREYRIRNFRNDSLEEVRIALALAPERFDEAGFEHLLTLYEARREAAVVASDGQTTRASAVDLGLEDVPSALLASDAPPDPTAVEGEVGGQSTLVVGATGRSEVRYHFFFSLEQLDDSLSELARISAAGWVFTVLLAGTVGHVVARATLRPVAATATAAEAIAAGDIGARLDVAGDDEFGALSRSFNHMVDELQETITKLEQAAERERRFTADVAHELRTPLTGMSASAGILVDQLDELPPRIRRPAAVLVADVDRLRRLVLGLLELSQLDAGTDVVEAEALRVMDAVRAIVAGARARREAGIDLDVEPGLSVCAEPIRLGRILGNLVDNAITHGGGSIQLVASRDGAEVVIEIMDDGPGIPEEELDFVFERFYKSDRSRASGGSGLGLSIAREQARSQGGDLSVANRPGGGARFTLRLPAVDTPPVAPSNPPEDPEAT